MSLEVFVKNYHKFTENEKKIVSYISSNLEEVAESTSRELSEKLYISKTSLINFCKKLGFDGFAEMKYFIKSYLDNIQNDNEVSNENIKDKLMNEVKKTLELVKDESIEEFSKQIIEAHSIYVASRGTSKQVAISFCHSLNMLGIPAVFIDNFNLINVMKSHIGPNETIIIISLSGETKILQDLAKFSKINKSKLLTITGFHLNPIQELSDYSLNFYSDIRDTKYRDIHSRIGMQVIINLIINKIDDLLKGENFDN